MWVGWRSDGSKSTTTVGRRRVTLPSRSLSITTLGLATLRRRRRGHPAVNQNLTFRREKLGLHIVAILWTFLADALRFKKLICKEVG